MLPPHPPPSLPAFPLSHFPANPPFSYSLPLPPSSPPFWLQANPSQNMRKKDPKLTVFEEGDGGREGCRPEYWKQVGLL